MENLRRATQALHIPGMGHGPPGGGGGGSRATQKRRTATEEAIEQLKFPKKHKPVFVDAKAMKEKLRKNMHKKRYDVHDFYWETGFCQKIAKNNVFENLTLAVIAFNALWIAIDCDLNDAELLHEAHPIFILAENGFCLFFTVELLLRFGAFKVKYNCLRDAWFCFDSFMVVMMVLETWVMTIILVAIGGGGSSGGLGNASLLRLLRLLRLSRMARMARLLRSCPELLILIKGMVAAIRSVFFTLLLLLIILYVFAILFRQLTAKTTVGDEYFPGVLTAMNALTLDGILFDSAGDMTGLIIEEGQQYLLPFFYCFILLATLTVLNMLIGVLCEVINNVAICEHEELTIAHMKEALEPIVAKYCKDITTQVNEDTGETETILNIGKPEFLEILQDPDTPLLLKDVKVDPFGLVDLVDTIFATEQGTERILDFGGFVEAMMDQRETETATVKDVTELRKYVRGRIDRKEDGLEAYMNSLGNMVERLTEQPQGTYMEEVQKAKKTIFKERGINLGIDDSELKDLQKENQIQNGVKQDMPKKTESLNTNERRGSENRWPARASQSE